MLIRYEFLWSKGKEEREREREKRVGRVENGNGPTLLHRWR
jgi:hypothetical protein